MRGFITVIAAVFAASGNTTAAEPTQKPDVIFVLSDDLAQGDVGCYGQKLIKTPHLDAMGREGTRFTQAYCGTSVCAPSRTSLMVGRHTGHSPLRANRRATKLMADAREEHPNWPPRDAKKLKN